MIEISFLLFKGTSKHAADLTHCRVVIVCNPRVDNLTRVQKQEGRGGGQQPEERGATGFKQISKKGGRDKPVSKQEGGICNEHWERVKSVIKQGEKSVVKTGGEGGVFTLQSQK